MMTDLIGGLWDDGSDAAVAKTGLDRAGLVGLITANTVHYREHGPGGCVDCPDRRE